MKQAVKRIGVLGAGRSAGYLIEYLGGYCQQNGLTLQVFDLNFERLQASFAVADSVSLVVAELGDAGVLDAIVAGVDLVVSVLPPTMHISVAKACLKHGRHLFTASYTSDEMHSLGVEAAKKGLLFMNELGLDPGIDHLSASRLLDQARSEGLQVEGFESHCGGLVAMGDCEGNPWQYKFTWNPTNVVLAGQGGDCVWKEDGQTQRLPGMDVFQHARSMDVPGLGTFDLYPNRNSLTYEQLYGLGDAKTLLRGTLRRNGFCKAWGHLVNLGFTDAQHVGDWQSAQTWFEAHTGCKTTADWVAVLAEDASTCGLGPFMSFLRLDEGVAELETVGKTSAQILEKILLDRWRLEEDDKDEVVMVHRLDLRAEDGSMKQWFSVLSVQGEGGDRTAMAKTVGLPLAMGVETFLEGDAAGQGAVIPFDKSWYAPILAKLEEQGIAFVEYVS